MFRRASGTKRRCATCVRPRRPPRYPRRRQSMSHRPRSNGCAPVFREQSDQRSNPARRRARRRPPVSQRGRAPSRATIPAFGCSGRTVRTEGCRGRSHGWRGCRCLEGVPTGFSVSFEAGAGHDPSGEFRCVLARRAPGREKFAAGVGFGRGRRSSPIGGRVRVRSRCPAGVPDDARARSNGYSEVGCRRGHGLHAVRRRIDRGGASKRTGAVRLHRRVARAHRKQFITRRHALVAGHGAVAPGPSLIAPRRRHFSVVAPGAKLSATPFMQ